MSSESIICADDDEAMRNLYNAILTSRGYHVRLCSDGTQVIPEYESIPAHLIILDIDMPGRNGLDVCRDLRTHAEAFDVPIIMCSSYESEEVIVNAITSGADEYLIKPPRKAELLAKVTAVIRKRQDTSVQELGLPQGSVFAGKYKILKKLGTGGFSRVFLAEDITTTPPLEVAVKILEVKAAINSRLDPLPLFLREAYGLSKLNHPNIIRFHHFGECHSQYFLAMEFARGKSLRQILNERGPIRELKAAAIGYHIVQSLKYLSDHTIVHRDITPQNIMILDTGDIKLIDFGLAKLVQDCTLTPEGMFSGSPLFAAPELILNQPLDTRADIFSLGATLYTCVTDCYAYAGSTPMEIFKNRFSQKSIPIKKQNPTLSDNFSNLIEEMMKVEKDERPSLKSIESTLLQLSSIH